MDQLLKDKKNASTGAEEVELMKAAVFTSPGKIDVKEVAIPEPKSNQVLVRLEGCGICASNIPVFQGREWFQYPFEAGAHGHEGWGIVEEVGMEVKNFKPGDRVALLSYHAYAQFDVADENMVVKLPEALKDKAFPGEPLGCAINIFERSDIRVGHTVAIVGIGFLGAMLTQLAKNHGAKVIAISRRETSLEMARDFGADEVIKMDDHWRIIDEVKKITEEQMCDRVIEAVGYQWPLDLAGELVKEGGKLIVAGYHQDGSRQVNMQMWNWKGMDVINAHERDPKVYIKGIEKAVNAVVEGRLNPEQLYTNFYQLNDIRQAFEDLINRPEGFVKAIVRLG
jgi:threonine dehydrogenase-like Zn-dependent dehydrogenase